MELWKHTRTRVDALFVSVIAVDGASCDSGPSGEGSAIEVIKTEVTFKKLS